MMAKIVEKYIYLIMYRHKHVSVTKKISFYMCGELQKCLFLLLQLYK